MKKKIIWSTLIFLMVIAVITTITVTLNAEPTMKIDGISFPRYPEGYKELKAQIAEIERKIELLKNGECDEFADERQEFEAKVQAAKKELDQLTREVEVLENTRKESWSVLPKETQDELTEKIKENPNLKVFDVKDLRPDGVSYKQLAKIVRDGKAVVEPQKKLEEQKQEYEKLKKGEENFEEYLMGELEEELRKVNLHVTIKIESHLIMILAEIISRHPDFATLEAECPLEDLIPAVSDLVEKTNYDVNGLDMSEDILFNLCENLIWRSRPCALKSEPARIALKFWTAFMRGDYEEVKKYFPDGPDFAELRSNPEFNEKLPVNPNFHGYVSWIQQEGQESHVMIGIASGENKKSDFAKQLSHDWETVKKRIPRGAKDNEVIVDHTGDTVPEIVGIVLGKDEDGVWKVEFLK